MNQNHSSYTPNRFKCFSGSTLKLIAIVSMLIDHTAAAFIYHAILLPNAPISVGTNLYIVYQIYKGMRFIGRIAFPIFCFLLVQGFLYTSSRKKYLIRLAVFAVISEIPFDLALKDQFFDFQYQNVYFTLLIGLLVMMLMEHFEHHTAIQMFAVLCGMIIAELLKTDYGYHGILLISILYFFRFHSSLQTFAGSLSLLWEAPAILAFIPINLYNQKRGLSLKYIFYIFYPAHLLLLALIRFFYNTIL